MDRSMAVLVWATVFALLFGVWGFLHGGLARFFAQKWRRSPEDTAGQAFRAGAAGGAGFGTALGVPVGGLAGYLQVDDRAGVGLTAAFLVLLGVAATAAIVPGLI